METHYVPREQFDTMWEQIESAPTAGVYPKCPVCGEGYATEQMIRSSPGKRAITFACEHVVMPDKQ